MGIWEAGNVLVPDLDASHVLEFSLWTAAKLHADDLHTSVSILHVDKMFLKNHVGASWFPPLRHR